LKKGRIFVFINSFENIFPASRRIDNSQQMMILARPADKFKRNHEYRVRYG